MPPLPPEALELAPASSHEDVQSSELWFSDAELEDRTPTETTPITQPSRHSIYPPPLPTTEPADSDP